MLEEANRSAALRGGSKWSEVIYATCCMPSMPQVHAARLLGVTSFTAGASGHTAEHRGDRRSGRGSTYAESADDRQPASLGLLAPELSVMVAHARVFDLEEGPVAAPEKWRRRLPPMSIVAPTESAAYVDFSDWSLLT